LSVVYTDLLLVHEDACTFGLPLLTEAGVDYLRRWLQRAALPGLPDPRCGTDVGALLACELPRWTVEDRQLWFDGRLLKEFRQPAPNQTTLLAAFEEQGWPAHIDDPLPRAEWEGEEDAKRRLHETIKNLNRGLPAGTMRFRGDGTGRGVVWEAEDGVPDATTPKLPLAK
jgi:hypothetical protein